MSTAEFDGTLLRKKAYGSHGSEMAVAEGRIEDGAVIWTSRTPEAAETIREWIEDGVYRMEGTGRIGVGDEEAHFVYEGRFERIASKEKR